MTETISERVTVEQIWELTEDGNGNDVPCDIDAKVALFEVKYVTNCPSGSVPGKVSLCIPCTEQAKEHGFVCVGCRNFVNILSIEPIRK